MKINLKDNYGMYIQKRDLDYLIDQYGFIPTEAFTAAYESMKEQDFLHLLDPKTIDYINQNKEIIEYKDYLRMSDTYLSIESENVSQIYNIALSLSKKKQKKAKSKAELETIAKEVARKKYIDDTYVYLKSRRRMKNALGDLNLGYDKNGYYTKGDMYTCYETLVEGVYAFTKNNDQDFSFEDPTFRKYYQEQEVTLLMKKQGEETKKNYLLSMEQSKDRQLTYLIIAEVVPIKAKTISQKRLLKVRKGC